MTALSVSLTNNYDASFYKTQSEQLFQQRLSKENQLREIKNSDDTSAENKILKLKIKNEILKIKNQETQIENKIIAETVEKKNFKVQALKKDYQNLISENALDQAELYKKLTVWKILVLAESYELSDVVEEIEQNRQKIAQTLSVSSKAMEIINTNKSPFSLLGKIGNSNTENLIKLSDEFSTNLKELIAGENFSFGFDQMTTLAAQCPNIEFLAIYLYSDYCSNSIATIAREFKYLKQLDLSDMNFINTKSIKDLKFISSLTNLDISKTAIDDKGLKIISTNKNLTHLKASNISITNEGVPHLAQLTVLKYLDLSHTYISDLGMQIISAFSNLESLCVQGCSSITEEGEKSVLAAGIRIENWIFE